MPGPSHHGPHILTEEEKLHPPKVTKELLRRIFGCLAPYWPQLLLVSFSILLAAVLDLMPSILAGRIIDEGFIGGDFDLLLILVAASFGVLLASNLIGILENYLNVWVSQHIAMDMRNKMYAHLQTMSHRFFTSSKQGDAITRLTSDIGGVETVVSSTLTATLSNLAVLATSIVAMYRVNWLLATVGIAIVPLFALPTRLVGRRRWGLTLQAQEKNDALNQTIHETLGVSGQLLVKLFTGEKREYTKFASINKDMSKLNIKESMAGRWFRVGIHTFTAMGPMIIYLTGGILMLRMGVVDMTVGDITVMVALLTRMYRPVNTLLGIQVDFTRALALFSRIFEYFDLPAEVTNRPGAAKPERLVGDLSFENVNFSYNPDQPVLRNVSFEVPAGKTVAIVGPSGAGKSTIINLIPRLYDVTGGRICLDGRDIRDLDLTYLRGQVGVVTQDSYLFNGTVRENLLYAKPDAPQQELEEACREANVDGFVAGLPEGYDTLVGNRGIKLSGGERQRLSIARVILKDPRLLILDEATSSLDSISESLIQQAIEPLLRRRTSLVIAHRLSTVMAADEILVIQDGRIVEQGPHKALLAAGGVYTTLYETQFRQVLQDKA